MLSSITKETIEVLSKIKVDQNFANTVVPPKKNIGKPKISSKALSKNQKKEQRKKAAVINLIYHAVCEKNKIQNPEVKVRGITLSSLAVGIRYKDRRDLCLIKIKGPSNSIVRFTSNRFPAAPIIVSKKHLNKKEPKYFLINAGNANAATGQKGIKDVIDICGEISKLAGCEKEDVLMFSTGVIGELLPANKIISCLPKLFETNMQSGWSEAAKAIMTTDTFPKISVREFELGGQKYSLAGICKGSGMIQPKWRQCWHLLLPIYL